MADIHPEYNSPPEEAERLKQLSIADVRKLAGLHFGQWLVAACGTSTKIAHYLVETQQLTAAALLDKKDLAKYLREEFDLTVFVAGQRGGITDKIEALKAVSGLTGPSGNNELQTLNEIKEMRQDIRSVTKMLAEVQAESQATKRKMDQMAAEVAASKRYSPSPSGAQLRVSDTIRLMTDAVYWNVLKNRTKERSLSFSSYMLAPGPPDLALCTSEKRKKEERFKVHSAHCHDECTPCEWTSESVVQAYWRLQLFPLLQPLMQEAKLVDRHAHKAIPSTFFTNELSPDIVLYCDKTPEIDFYILSVGEIKFSSNITDEHCGQLAKYVQALFDLHPHRCRLYGWLATQDKLRLFKFKKNTDHDIESVETSHDLSYADGLQQLCTMLRLDGQELGVFTQPIPMPARADICLKPERYLGRGTFATAYAASTPDKGTVVIKLFRSDAEGAAALRREEACLKELQVHNIAGITKLVGSVCYPPRPAAAPRQTVLVVQPEGVTLERVVRRPEHYPQYRLTGAAIGKLLDIIRSVHEVGQVVHCDLSLTNMYFLPDGEMLINDFGSAVKRGERARKGNLYFMPRAVQEQPDNEYLPQPEHDLETFVKVLMYSISTRISANLRRTPPGEAAAFWMNQETISDDLKQLLRLARSCNYEGLKAKAVLLAAD